MLNANRGRLVQSTNQTMVSIRQQEVDYFCDIYAMLGINCAFIAGFVLTAVVQVPVYVNHVVLVSIFWRYLYYLSSAISFVLATHVMFCTCFIIVFGQGLAIRGPIGSLAVAIEGMLIERHQVMNSFVGSLIFFSLQIIGIFFIQMSVISAILASVLAIFVFYIWYKYTLRIYNRFKLKDDGAFFWGNTKKNDARKSVGTNDSLVAPLVQSLSVIAEKQAKSKGNDVDSKSADFLRKSANKYEQERQISTPTMSTDSSSNLLLHDGVISYKFNYNVNKADGSSGIEGPTWVHCYAVLNNNLIFLYKDKDSYRRDPFNTLKKRPLDIEGFVIETDNFQKVNKAKTSSASSGDNVKSAVFNNLKSSIASSGVMTRETPSAYRDTDNDLPGEMQDYRIRLHSADPNDDRLPVDFLCDNAKEKAIWLEVFQKAVKMQGGFMQ